MEPVYKKLKRKFVTDLYGYIDYQVYSTVDHMSF